MEPCSEASAADAVKYAEEKFNWTFYDEQKSAIMSFLTGKDIFVGLPTGFGKSQVYQAIPVCYQFLVNKEPIAIVISPLLSLCRNQVQALTDIGMKAVYLGDVNDDDTRKKLKAGQLCSFIPVPR